MVKLAPKPKTHWRREFKEVAGEMSPWTLGSTRPMGAGAAYCTISWSLEGGSIKRNSGPSTKLSICFLSSLQAAPSRSHRNSIAQLVMVNVHTVKMHLTFYVLMTQLQAHSRTWPWPPPLFYRESIACPIFLQTLDTGINRIQNRNHSITPRITPLHLIILHHVSLSYLYFTPHNPVHPVRKRSPQKKKHKPALYVKILDPPILVGEMLRLKFWYQKNTRNVSRIVSSITCLTNRLTNRLKLNFWGR